MSDTHITVTTQFVPNTTPVEVLAGPPVNLAYNGAITNNSSVVTIPQADLLDVASVEITVRVIMATETVSTKVNIVPETGQATLDDFGTLITSVPHTFTINDPSPLPGRRYDLWINDVDQGDSVVYPTQQITASNFAVGGPQLNIVLKYWDNDVFENRIEVSGIAYTSMSPRLQDFGTVLDGETHTFTVIDPAPEAGRRYDIWVNGVDGGFVSIVYPTLTTTRTGLPTDGSVLALELRSWDNDDFNTVVYTTGTATAAGVASTGSINSPANTILSSANVTFAWTINNSSKLQAIELFANGADAATDTNPIYKSGALSLGTTSHAATGLPTDGRNMEAVLVEYNSNALDGRYIAAQRSYKATGGATSSWVNALDPAVSIPLSNPLIIRGYAALNAYQTATWPQTSNQPPGLFTNIRLNQGQDCLIDMRGETQTVTRPIIIGGRGRNVAVLGIDFESVAAPAFNGAPSGAIGNYVQDPSNRTAIKNTHPRPVSLRCMEISCEGVSWIEGAYVNAAGHDADAFVCRSATVSGQSTADAKARRKFYFVNLRARGMEGNDYGYHGDFQQNQGKDTSQLSPGEEKDSLNAMHFENVTSLTAYNQITHHSWDGHRLQAFSLNRCYFDFDDIYSDDQSNAGMSAGERPDPQGGPVFSFWPADVDPEGLNISDVYYRSTGFNYWAFAQNKTRLNTNDEKIYATQYWNGDPIPVGTSHRPTGWAAHSGLRMIDGDRSTFRDDTESSGGYKKPVDSIPATQFSPRDAVGKYYVSPFNAYWDTF